MIKNGGDITSVSILALTLNDVLPTIATVLTIIWVAIRIWETQTISSIFKDDEKESDLCTHEKKKKKKRPRLH